MRLFHPDQRKSAVSKKPVSKNTVSDNTASKAAGLKNQGIPHSGSVAKERLSTLLAAERLNCSPGALQMLKNDLTHAAEKYLLIDYSEVSLTITQSPAVLTARIPLKKQEESHVKTL